MIRYSYIRLSDIRTVLLHAIHVKASKASSVLAQKMKIQTNSVIIKVSVTICRSIYLNIFDSILLPTVSVLVRPLFENLTTVGKA